MISLSSEFTDTKGRHARGWIFYDAECDFCTRIARWIRKPIERRGLAVAPLQDPRVAALLGIPASELLRAIRYLGADGLQYAGADALVEVAEEFWWARPLVWASRFRAAKAAMRTGYEWVARQRKCHAETHCRRRGGKRISRRRGSGRIASLAAAVDNRETARPNPGGSQK